MMVTKPPSSLISLNHLHDLASVQDKTINRIASGKQILTGSDDPAGLAVAMILESQFRGLSREMTNRQDEISLIQTAEGGIGQITQAIQRIRELSLQATNGTLTDSDRRVIQTEISQLNQHIDQIAKSTEFNTKKLLDGTLEITLQNGNNLKIPNMSSASLGTSEIDVSSTQKANEALGKADKAITTTTSERSSLGAISNGIASEINSIQQQIIDTMTAHSRIADADIARQIVELTRLQIQRQATIQVFRVDNTMRSQVLNLLGNT